MENCAAKIKLIIIVYKLLQRFPLGQDMKLLLTRLYWYKYRWNNRKINRNRLIAFFPRYLRLHHFHSAVTRFHCIRIISTVFFFPIYIYLLRIIYIIAATCLLFRDDLYLRIRETSRGRARAKKREREKYSNSIREEKEVLGRKPVFSAGWQMQKIQWRQVIIKDVPLSQRSPLVS